MSRACEPPTDSSDPSQGIPRPEELKAWKTAQKSARRVLDRYDKRVKQFLEKYGNSWPAGSEIAQEFGKLLAKRYQAFIDAYRAFGFTFSDKRPNTAPALAAWIEQEFITAEMVAMVDKTASTGKWAEGTLEKALEYAKDIIESDPSLPELPKESVNPKVALRYLQEWCIRCQSPRNLQNEGARYPNQYGEGISPQTMDRNWLLHIAGTVMKEILTAAISIAKPAGLIETVESYRTVLQSTSKEQPWTDDAPEYLHLSDIHKMIENRFSLPKLSKLAKPDGEICYMRKGHRCKVHVGDFRRYMKGQQSDPNWARAYIDFREASGKGDLRWFQRCKSCGHEYPENAKAPVDCPKCGGEVEITRKFPPKPRW